MTGKRSFWLLTKALLVVLILLGISLMCFISNRSAATIPARTITVSGEGKTVVSPDIATVSFSVISEGKDPATIQAQNTAKMNKAIDFLKAQGIKPADIQTSQYDLSPRYDYTPRVISTQPVLTGYVLTQSVAVKIRDLKKAGDILAGLPATGVNNISSLQFSVDDPDVFLNQARAKAFDKARVKAETMAKQNHIRLGEVVTFSESTGGNYPRPYYDLKAEAAGAPTSAPSPVIEAGSQEVTVQVSVTYELR